VAIKIFSFLVDFDKSFHPQVYSIRFYDANSMLIPGGIS
jgi:hypothetical protein